MQAAVSASSANVVIAFEKWVNPNDFSMLGVVSLGSATGTYTGQVTAFSQPGSSGVGRLGARYDVHLPSEGIDFSADVAGQQVHTGRAVLNGVVTTGSYAGARVHVEYQATVIDDCSAAAQAGPNDGFCYIGTIRVMPGSAQ
jgi:hypothetical protein